MMRAQAQEFLKTDLISRRGGKRGGSTFKEKYRVRGEKMSFAIFLNCVNNVKMMEV